MESKIKICGKEYEAKASFLTMETFYTLFGKDFLGTLNEIQEQLNRIKNADETTNLMMEFSGISFKAIKIAYVMIKEKDPTFKSYEEFLGEIDGLYDNPSWITEVVELAGSVFRRSLSQQKQN